MNELTVFVQYRPLSKLAAGTLEFIWFVLAAAALFLCVPILHALPWYLQVLFWAAGGLFFVYVPFVIVSFEREGGLLVLNGAGITFPPALLGFGPQYSLAWSELKTVDYTQQRHPKLLLTTQGGFPLSIKTEKMPPEQLCQLLLALEIWSPNACWSSRASEFRDATQNNRLGIETDFTKMWDAELKRRYSAVTFTPHQPGTRLQDGRLTILKQLAFGGFSAIYLAEDSNREKVVLKELVIKSADSTSASKAKEMFEKEARLLAKVDHPNIAHILDHFVENEHNYLVLQLADGENLRELVRRKAPLEPETVLNLCEQMLDMLEYLHGLQPPMVHRDFTPDNLVRSASGELTLVDFGAANEYATAATGTLVGKQSYMPIEQIRGHAEPRSDLYSLGCTLYFLLTGNDPEPLSVCVLPHVNPRLAAIIAKLTQIEPEDRFPSIDDVRQALDGPAVRETQPKSQLQNSQHHEYHGATHG